MERIMNNNPGTKERKYVNLIFKQIQGILDATERQWAFLTKYLVETEDLLLSNLTEDINVHPYFKHESIQIRVCHKHEALGS